MKKVLGLMSFVLFFGLINAFGQFIKVYVQVDGLTCSACSYATQRSLLTLNFVDSVSMDLNTNIATVTFKEGKKVEIDKIAQKVKDAGFSVGSLIATLNYGFDEVNNNYCIKYIGDTYHFIGRRKNGWFSPVKIKFIGEDYMEKKEFKKWKTLITGECDPQSNLFANHKIYFVTFDL